MPKTITVGNNIRWCVEGWDMVELERPRESSDGKQDGEKQVYKLHAEIQVGKEDLVEKQKQHTEALKGGASSGITNEFGKPAIDHGVVVPTRLVPQVPELAILPNVGKQPDSAEAHVDKSDSSKLEANAEALLWDKWNQSTHKVLTDEVSLCLERKHPDLRVPDAYKDLATDVPHFQAKYDVTVQSDGTITSIQMTKPSGSAYFDQAVKRGIEHMGASGKLQFPAESHLQSRVLHINYGWNWKGGTGYPKGQIEQDGKLHQ
jgi:hypothetical protein